MEGRMLFFFFGRGRKAYSFFINKEEYLQNRTENERKKKREKKEENAEAFKKKRKINKNEADLIVCRSVSWQIIIDER
jgi:hypothetical protein